jgi:hypothetical protein
MFVILEKQFRLLKKHMRHRLRLCTCVYYVDVFVACVCGGGGRW